MKWFPFACRQRYGIHYVDFENDERPRTPKRSAFLLKEIFITNGFNNESFIEPTMEPPEDITSEMPTSTDGGDGNGASSTGLHMYNFFAVLVSILPIFMLRH